jgi:hypothetical protein
LDSKKKGNEMIKRIIIFAIAVTFALPATALSQKVKDGFKGYKWGTSFSEMDSVFELDSIGVNDEVVYYLTNIDSLASVPLYTSSFGYYKGKFCAVMLVTQGYSDWQKLFKAFKATYGEPKRRNRFLESYFFYSKGTLRTAEYNTITERGTFGMVSKEIWQEIERDSQKAAERTKDEF